MRSQRHSAERASDLLDDPQFFMLAGISQEQNTRLQDKANAVVRQLFRRRVRNPDRLLSDLRAALQRSGFIYAQVEMQCPDIHFRARIGQRLKLKLGSKHFSDSDTLYGCVTRAARGCGLDPRIEDVGVSMNGNTVEGFVNVVPFIHQTRAIDKAFDSAERNHGRARGKLR